MDDAERAMRHEELSRQIAMTKRYPILSPTGYCHYCGSPTRHRMLFCDPISTEGVKGSCRDDWEREKAAKRRNGDD